MKWSASGDIDWAIFDVEKQFPQVMKLSLEVWFLLHPHKFIEMIMNRSRLQRTRSRGITHLSKAKISDVAASPGGQDGHDGNGSDGDGDAIISRGNDDAVVVRDVQDGDDDVNDQKVDKKEEDEDDEENNNQGDFDQSTEPSPSAMVIEQDNVEDLMLFVICEM